MSIWHEVHCDVNSPNCHSSVNNNPSAWTKAYAVQKARAAGWKIGRRAVCPGCQNS